MIKYFQLAVLLLVVAIDAREAGAQVTLQTVPPQPQAFGPDPVVRITTSFRAPASVDGHGIPDAKSQETARQQLYRMADGECAILSDIYKADCRMGSVVINSPALVPNAAITSVLTATATYELRARR